MENRKILCYGDSNTYGYDPRDPFGGRLGSCERFPCLLSSLLRQEVLEDAENGRRIPVSGPELHLLRNRLQTDPDIRLIVCMLGTNDLLCGEDPESAAGKAEKLIRFLRQHFPERQILLLSPPEILLPEYAEASLHYSDCLEKAAEHHGLPFLGAGKLPLFFDGIHLSPEGHRLLAEKLADFINTL